MKTKFISALLGAVVTLGPVQAMAKAAWDCSFPTQQESSWIGQRWIVVDNGNTVTGLNVATQHFMGGAQTAKVTKNTDRILKGSWEIKRIKDNRSQRGVGMRFGFVLNKQTMRINVTALPHGFTNSFSAAGNCEKK